MADAAAGIGIEAVAGHATGGDIGQADPPSGGGVAAFEAIAPCDGDGCIIGHCGQLLESGCQFRVGAGGFAEIEEEGGGQ